LARHRRELHTSEEAFDVATDDASPLEELEENERIIAVQKAIEQMGNPCRDLLLLFYWEERSMEEIAMKLGFANADTVKSKKYQCKKSLEHLVRTMLGGSDG
jgi:RNA polymerase sigma factor (sigma-70 family)